jgi:hypothetical protein
MFVSCSCVTTLSAVNKSLSSALQRSRAEHTMGQGSAGQPATAMAQPRFSSSCSPRRPPPSTSASTLPLPSSWSPPRHAPRRRAVAAAAALHLGPGEIAELARNKVGGYLAPIRWLPLLFFFSLLIRGLLVCWKVLIAATAASAIGQLSKPFTSGKDGPGLDLRTVFRSGGMPSTHSAVSKMIIHSLTVCFLQFFALLSGLSVSGNSWPLPAAVCYG